MSLLRLGTKIPTELRTRLELESLAQARQAWGTLSMTRPRTCRTKAVEQVLRTSRVGRYAKATATVLIALGILTGSAAAATKPWTKAQVQRTIVAKMIVKCPGAMLWLATGDPRAARKAREHQAYCDDPSEPKRSRIIVACGVTSNCLVPNGPIEGVKVDERDLRFHQLLIQLHDKGRPAVYAKCISGNIKSRFVCGVQLANDISMDQGWIRLCVDVTAQGRTFRWKVKDVWRTIQYSSAGTHGVCGALATRPRQPVFVPGG